MCPLYRDMKRLVMMRRFDSAGFYGLCVGTVSGLLAKSTKSQPTRVVQRLTCVTHEQGVISQKCAVIMMYRH